MNEPGKLGHVPGEAVIELFDRMVHHLEERVAIAEARATEVEGRMREALHEAHRRAEESGERANALEELLRKSAEERLSLIAALQEAIKASQLQTAAPVALAQAEAARDQEHGATVETEHRAPDAPTAPAPAPVPPPPPPSAEPAPPAAEPVTPVVIQPRKPAPKPSTARRFRRFFGSGKKR